MGLKIPEFYQLTPREFDNYLKGYQSKQERETQLKLVLNRDLEFAIISPYLDSKKPNCPKTPKEYKPFYWEVENNQPEAGRKFKSKAEVAASFKKIDAKKEQ